MSHGGAILPTERPSVWLQEGLRCSRMFSTRPSAAPSRPIQLVWETGLVTDSTDDDAGVLPEELTAPKWLTYELDVAREIGRIEPLAEVTHNASLTGFKSGVQRQIDVLAERTLFGVPARVVVECKRYSKKLGIGKVDEFVGKLLDTGAEMGILYAYSGVTPGAQKRADGQLQPKVTIRDLETLESTTAIVAEAETVGVLSLQFVEPSLPAGAAWGDDAMRALGYEPCANENCHDPEVGLFDWPSGERAGYCPSCGSLNHECSICEEIDIVDGRSSCFGCGSIFDTQYDSDALIDDVVLVERGPDLEATGNRQPAPGNT